MQGVPNYDFKRRYTQQRAVENCRLFWVVCTLRHMRTRVLSARSADVVDYGLR